jgi:hypothetical protein
MTTYTQQDVLNQQATVAAARLAQVEANATYIAAQNQLQIIQATITKDTAEAAALAAAS